MNDFRRASVLVGDVETSYRRGGAGSPLLLLVPPPRDAAPVEALARTARVLIPEATSILALPSAEGDPAFARWLRGFLDGLGLLDVTVVAPPALASELRQFDIEAPGYLARILIADDPPHDWARLTARIRGEAAD